ncbi:MAG TPA: alpha-ketoglutarate-dependent dioxygenase AlkB [Herpetosiphonaceae bacterium]
MNSQADYQAITGLRYIADYITEAEQERIIEIIDAQTWQNDLKRRVQHYGYKYDYKKRFINFEMYLGALPEWLLMLAQKLVQDRLVSDLPDQVIVNEYLPGQGISSHVDCVPCFDDTIVSLSLNSFCVMEFTHTQSAQKIPVLLEPRSVVVLQGESRYSWKHGIASRKIDVFNNTRIQRARRLSLTFRKIVH